MTHFNSNPSKIDAQTTLGVDSTFGSLAHTLQRLSYGCSSGASWFEKAGTPTATHFADRIGIAAGGGDFQIDGGDSSATPTWGSWVQILGSGDTPARTTKGMQYFTLYRMLVTDVEKSAKYLVQITRGASGAAGFAAETYTEIVYEATNTRNVHSIDIHSGWAPSGSLLWARCQCVGENTGTMDFNYSIIEAQV